MAMIVNYFAAPGLKKVSVQSTDEEIIKAVDEIICKVWNVDMDDVKSRWRKRQPTRARQFAMWYLRKNTMMSLNEIGRMYGKRDHSTVLNAIKIIDQTNERTDWDFWMQIEEALRFLNN